jgi:hypothetical protein
VARQILEHGRCRQIAADLLRCMNDCLCGGVVWRNSVPILSCLVEESHRRTAFGRSMGAVTNVDRVFSPADQRVLLDVMLRQADYVPVSQMRLWRLWLNAVTWYARQPLRDAPPDCRTAQPGPAGHRRRAFVHVPRAHHHEIDYHHKIDYHKIDYRRGGWVGGAGSSHTPARICLCGTAGSTCWRRWRR